MAHSLVRERLELLNELASGDLRVTLFVGQGSGENEHRMTVELPPEEAFESFAARLRPFTMRKEPVYWELVLDAIEALVSEETRTEIIDIEDLRDHWKTVAEGTKIAQAYYVRTDSGQLSDVQLADLWLNSDALHTQPIQSQVGRDVSLNRRYQAAAGVYARIGACVNTTYYLVNQLYREGLLELDSDAFTVPVMADTTIDLQARIYSAAVGAELPTDLSDLDPDVWRPIDQDIELLGGPDRSASD
jgi:hypothetical protein